MRYTESYDEWATRAENRSGGPRPSERELAAARASRIRDNHSGSSQDSRELARMERIAHGSKRYDSDDKPRKTLNVIKESVQHVERELVFDIDGYMIRMTVHQDDLIPDHLERLISSELAARDYLDLSINGFADGSTLKDNRFTARLNIADYDYDDECDINARTVDIEATIYEI